jgi:ABC-type sugar transport system permease subunit
MNRWISKRFIALYLAPALLVYLAFFVYPAIDALRISFYEWSGFSLGNAEFVGLENFATVLRDKQLQQAAGNNVFLLIAGGLLTFALALFFAAALSQGRLRGGEYFKATIFAPYTISAVAVALLWSFIYNPQWGLLNTTLRLVGLDALAQPILAFESTAFPAVSFVVVWHSLGFYMILLFAGIQAIPSDYMDAARIDGASEVQSFFHVTLPLLRDVLIIAVLHWIIGAIKHFGIAYAMTRGRPAGITHTISTYLYEWALPYYGSTYRLGYASAIAVSLFLVVVTISIVYLRLAARRESIQY